MAKLFSNVKYVLINKEFNTYALDCTADRVSPHVGEAYRTSKPAAVAAQKHISQIWGEDFSIVKVIETYNDDHTITTALA